MPSTSVQHHQLAGRGVERRAACCLSIPLLRRQCLIPQAQVLCMTMRSLQTWCSPPLHQRAAWTASGAWLAVSTVLLQCSLGDRHLLQSASRSGRSRAEGWWTRCGHFAPTPPQQSLIGTALLLRLPCKKHLSCLRQKLPVRPLTDTWTHMHLSHLPGVKFLLRLNQTLPASLCTHRSIVLPVC